MPVRGLPVTLRGQVPPGAAPHAMWAPQSTARVMKAHRPAKPGPSDQGEGLSANALQVLRAFWVVRSVFQGVRAALGP